ncbi:hypothetical protein GGR56DRAFT_656815 [Xylariaceae sp. FL0804]|nr:hypothetical protein GGR56DRAFT_656815 [Xylariaceae sp. FL0804]
MSPSPGDEAHSPQDSKNTGGLANVLKGLAGAAKLTKAPPPLAHPAAPLFNAQIANHLGSCPSASLGLPDQYADSFEKLKDGSPNERIAAANALRATVADYPLNPVLDIWYSAKDLIEPTNPKVTRIAGWELLTECAKHPSSTDLERKEYFLTITSPANPEDFHLQLNALASLADQGHDVSGFDYDIFPLLSTWLQLVFDSVRAARNAAKKSGSRSKGKALVTGEDRNFADLFAFVTDVLKFNFAIADDEALEALIDALITICNFTSVDDDLRACIGVMDAIVTFGAIPAKKMKNCVEVLCSIHCLVPQVQKSAWHTVSILCRSHNGQAVVRMLLEVLTNLPADAVRKKEGVREVRGVLSVLIKLVSKSSEKGYPMVPYALLVDGLSKVAQITSSWKINLDILRLTNVLLNNGQDNVNTMLTAESWTPILDVAVASSAGIVTLIQKADGGVSSPLSTAETENPETLIAKELTTLISRVQGILAVQQGVLIQRHDCIVFLAKVHPAIPDSAALFVLDYFKEFRCCFPSDAQWKTNLDLVLDAFFTDRKRSTNVRLQALNTITDVYDMVELLDDQIDSDFVPSLMKRLLKGVTDEPDLALLQSIASFAVTVAIAAHYPLFSHIIDTLGSVVDCDRVLSPVTLSLSRASQEGFSLEQTRFAKSQTASNIVARVYVQLFMRVVNVDVAKANRLFTLLISIVKSNNSETDARITAMQLLFRLRTDWANRIFVTLHTETSHLAATLYRTETTVRKMYEETSQSGRLSRPDMSSSTRTSRGVSFSGSQPQDRGTSFRVASASKTNTVNYKPIWTTSDLDSLPEEPYQTASPVLYSSLADAGPSMDQAQDQESVLPMGEWLDAVLALMHQGCDWEVYSFILVHLPSQLSNHALFRNTVPQLQELRRTVCDQIRLKSFPEPPTASGLRTADVAICLFHALTTILSYHRHFVKAEEDEIVRTFIMGISTWERCARCCIHALTICCHELPLSISKVLVTIMRHMAQIITQPYVAMHILEFLVCLSRLPSLYVNFREDEYKIVFGISFRYLQYVRGRKQTYHRPSTVGEASFTTAGTSASADYQVHPNASDDLPQYVYTLAYHVIMFWFLALKLPDRSSLVGWIAKYLFTDADGSQVSDEQAQITIDFMQRVAYADVDESAADPLFTSDRFGEILVKRWLIGNSIVTIEQAVTTGWAQITKRHPSGTSSYKIRERFRPPPAHQQFAHESTGCPYSESANNVLPSHLLVQLLSSLPQGNDAGRPLPLPDDEAVKRAIRVFDHNSTVDGHKVGVIYIGENQTDEAEILANISGSRDYVEFLNGLGTLTKLKGATFNTQGLDRQYDSDGQYTFCWRDRITELVFHVTTQMPTNLSQDPRCTLKKRHIGNDFVNIIFNDSGLPFKFDTFPSEFNYVNIVITPESRASFVATRQRTPKDVSDSFYKVHVMSKPGFPEISPAYEPKIVSLKALPDFIRLLALNASVFSLVWANRKGGEHISSWRNRLRDINRLREKYGPKAAPHGPSPSPPGTALGHGTMSINSSSAQLEAPRPGNTVRDSFSSLRRSSVATFFTTSSEQNSHRSSMLSTASTDNTEVMTANGLESLVDTVDFSKWA